MFDLFSLFGEEEGLVKEEKKETKVVSKAQPNPKETEVVEVQQEEEPNEDVEDVEDVDVEETNLTKFVVDESVLEKPVEKKGTEKPSKTTAKSKATKTPVKRVDPNEEKENQLQSKQKVIVKLFANEIFTIEGDECKEIKLDIIKFRLVNEFHMEEFMDGMTSYVIESKEDAELAYLHVTYKFQAKG